MLSFRYDVLIELLVNPLFVLVLVALSGGLIEWWAGQDGG